MHALRAPETALPAAGAVDRRDDAASIPAIARASSVAQAVLGLAILGGGVALAIALPREVSGSGADVSVFVVLAFAAFAVPPFVVGVIAWRHHSVRLEVIAFLVALAYAAVLAGFASPTFNPSHDYETIMQVGAVLGLFLAAVAAVIALAAAMRRPDTTSRTRSAP